MNREKVKGSEDSLFPVRWRSEERFKEPPESFDHRWDWPGSKSSAEKQRYSNPWCVCVWASFMRLTFLNETHLKKK